MMEVPQSDFTGPGRPSFGNVLTGRLLEQRLLVIQEVLTDVLVARTVEHLALLAADGVAPVKALVSLWGRAVGPGLALHDAFQSAGVPVRAVASGRVSGTGVVAFCGARERHALPGARFRLEEPTGIARGPFLGADVEAATEERRRMVALLAQATGQPEERIERDLEQGQAFTAEEAVHYGWVERIVRSAEKDDQPRR